MSGQKSAAVGIDILDGMEGENSAAEGMLDENSSARGRGTMGGVIGENSDAMG